MALIKCKNCGAEISDRAPDCIHCGALIIKENVNNQVSLQAVEKKLLEKEHTFQQTLSKLEEEKRNLENENAQCKIAVAEITGRLSNEQRQKSQLEAKNEALQQRNLELEQQIKDSLKRTKALEDEKVRAKKSKKAKAANKSTSTKIPDILRLILAAFLLFGALICLLSSSFRLASWYSLVAVSVVPYLYRIVWKKVKVATALRVIIQIIVPIIISVVFSV